MKNNAVVVKDLYKSFRVPIEASNGIKQKIINAIKGRRGYRLSKTLNGISFNIEEGEFFGIVGRNGSGKSTLLKMIAEIYYPDKGDVKVKGKLVPFIELGVGFNPELTGRENVYLNGALLGFSRSDMDAMYKEIVDFAELNDYMDERLKNYSSGMQVRLAFSIAIRAEGDILLLDEVLAVGDEAFQRKCFAYFAELKKNKKTVILVTHSMDSVQQFCTRAMMIDEGKIVSIGKPSVVAQKYRETLLDPAASITTSDTESDNILSNKFAEITPIVKVNKDTNLINIDTEVISKVDLTDITITFEIDSQDGSSVYRWVTDEKISKTLNIKKGMSVDVSLEIQNIFPDGHYNLQVGVKKRDRSIDYLISPNAASFDVVTTDMDRDAVRFNPNCTFSIKGN